MRNAVEEIHRAINRIDNPLAGGLLVARDAFFAVECIARASPEKNAGDEILRFLVERELDVVIRGFIDCGGAAEVLAEKFSRFKCGMSGKFEIGHDKYQMGIGEERRSA